MNNTNKEENTKELQNLDELREQAFGTLEQDINSIVDEFTEEEFQEEVIEKKEVTEEIPKKRKLIDKWKSLPKRKKIILLVITFMVLVIIGIGIYFFVTKDKTVEEKPSVPDVILQKQNYRYENGKLIFINDKKEDIGEYTCKNQDQELCFLATYQEENELDGAKLVYEDGTRIQNESSLFLDQYAFVYDNKEKTDGLIQLYDFKEKKDLETFLLVKGYKMLENQVVLKTKMNQYGLYEFTTEGLKQKIESTYDYMAVVENNKTEITKIVTKRNNKWYLTDLSNKTLTKAITYEIKDYNDKVIKVIDENKKYHLVDYNNAEIEKGDYDYIDFIDNYALFIKDDKLYVKDFDGNDMHLDGVKLENKAYVKTSTYSKENKLLKSEQSYGYELVGSVLTIHVYKDNIKSNVVIQLNEGRVSKLLKNMNYFDGKLYFYTDDAKTRLIGTYTCTNKNVLNDDTTELNNCMIASESFYQDNELEENKSSSLGLLPIYNERFAFIQDNPSLVSESDKTIVLYDFKDNALKSKYHSVDASVYNSQKNVTFSSANEHHVIAENKNGKYGIIKIGYNSVSGVVDFSYDHLEKINLNYIAQNSSGYFIMDSSGKAKTKTYTNKIRDFSSKYVKVINDKKYYLYDYEGKQVSKTGFDYISLYDKYFGAVVNQILNIYSYETPEKALVKDGIKLYSSNFYGTEKKTYTITFKTTGEAVVTVLNADNTTTNKTYDLNKIEIPGEPSEE